MNRTEKAAEIELLRERFTTSQIAIVTDYKGLDVASLTSLRHKLGETQTKFKVVKNRLAKIALKGTGAEGLSPHFVGTTAIATAVDPTAPAKVLTEFAKDHEFLKIKVGFLYGKVIDLKSIEQLAKLPSKEELIVKLMGSMLAPARNLVNVLAQIPRLLVNVLEVVRRQKEQAAAS